MFSHSRPLTLVTFFGTRSASALALQTKKKSTASAVWRVASARPLLLFVNKNGGYWLDEGRGGLFSSTLRAVRAPGASTAVPTGFRAFFLLGSSLMFKRNKFGGFLLSLSIGVSYIKVHGRMLIVKGAINLAYG